MLGLSLVVGWYLTLGLAERDGLPKETMANCYVVTAIAAVVGSRVLYILTNLDEFDSIGSTVRDAPRRPRRVRRLPRRLRRLVPLPPAAPDPAPAVGRRRGAEPRVGADDHAHRLLPVRLRLRPAAQAESAPGVAEEARHVPALGRRARSSTASGAPGVGAARARSAGSSPTADALAARSTRRSSTSRSSALALLASCSSRAQASEVPRADLPPLHVRVRRLPLPARDPPRRRGARLASRRRSPEHVLIPLGLVDLRGRLRDRLLARRSRTCRVQRATQVLAFVPAVVVVLRC